MHIHLTPLRDRGEDISLTAMLFLKRAAAHHRKPIRSYTPEAIEVLRTYAWPGNVRELCNRVMRGVVLAEGSEITPRDLDLTSEILPPADSLDSLRATHRRIAVELIVKAINLHRGNLTRVARDLEVSRSTLSRKQRTYNLEPRATSDATCFVTIFN